MKLNDSTSVPTELHQELPTPIDSSDLNPLRQRLIEVRRMPATTDQEKSDKRFEAMKLRMDNLLANAGMWNEIMDFIAQNPFATEEQVLVATQNLSSINVSTDQVSQVVSSVVAQKQVVMSCYENNLNDSEKSDSLKAGEMIYFFSSGINPQHPVKLVKSPFAVTIVVSPEDYKNIDPLDNTAGFYSANKTFTLVNIKTGKFETVTLPFVAITAGKYEKYIADHENAHAENRIFRESQSKKYQLTVRSDSDPLQDMAIIRKESIKTWGPYLDPRVVSKSSRTLIRRSDSYYQNPSHLPVEGEEDFNSKKNQLITYALGRAKDEIIAAMSEGGPARAEEHLQSLKEVNGVYDYFAKLGIKLGSRLYIDLTNRYHKDLDDQLKSSLELYRFYQGAGVFGHMGPLQQKRTKLFVSVLMQSPLSLWNSRLETSGFIAEFKAIEDVSLSIMGVQKNCAISSFVSAKLKSNGLNNVFAKAFHLKDGFIREIVNNPEVNLFSLVDRYKAEVNDLQRQGESIEMYRANALVNSFINPWRAVRDRLEEVTPSDDADFFINSQHFYRLEFDIRSTMQNAETIEALEFAVKAGIEKMENLRVKLKLDI